MIYTQQYAGQCGYYAALNCLQLQGVKITESEILAFPSIWGFSAISRTLIKAGYIKSVSYPMTQRAVNIQLKKGVPLIAKLTKNNFNSAWYYPFINELNGVKGHFVCLVEDCGDRYKYVDQQGEGFGDHGYAYIMKKDFSKYIIGKLNV